MEKQDLKEYIQGIIVSDNWNKPIPANRVLCGDCKYWEERTLKCKAFPNGIPLEIMRGSFDHHNPHPRDNGIQFNQK